jgi:general secretion pathway protein K
VSLRRQRGIALLVAIIMFALATTVAAAITYNKAMAARRAAATFTVEQALQAGMAAEALASIALENSAGGSSTNLTQDWAQTVGPLEIEGTGVWIQAQLEDMQGRFNLNSLVTQNQQTGEFDKDPQQVEVFEALLQSLGLETRWATLMVDWIDSDIAPDLVQGGEDTLYLTQVPPYRPPNTFITHPSELLALQGFGAERYKKLAPYVTALPQDVKINVCDARGVVLDAARNDPSNRVEFGPLDRPASDQLEQQRKKGCYPTRTDWLAGVSGTNNLNTLAGNRAEEKSSWFRLRTNIRVGTTEFVLYSLLLRERSNHVRVMQRSFGSE